METKDLNLENGNDLAAEVVAKESNNEKEIIKSVDKDFQDYTEEEIREFITNNKITTSIEMLRIDRAKLFCRVCRLNLLHSLGISDINENSTEKDIIQNCISEEGLCSHAFRKKYCALIKYVFDTYGTAAGFKYVDPTHDRTDWSQYSTIEDFQKYVDDNKFQSASDFEIGNPGLYARACVLKVAKKLKYPVTRNDYTDMDFDDFQQFIWDHPEIQRPTDFERLYCGMYSCALDRDYAKKLEYPNKRPERCSFSTIEEFQNFINENDIETPGILRTKFYTVYRKASRLGLLRELKFELRGTRSAGEVEMKRLLELLNIDFIEEKSFDWLVFIDRQRVDFYLPDFNICLEVQGEPHFVEVNFWGGEERLDYYRKTDLNKYNLCKENNMPLIYFAYVDDKYWKDKSCINNYFAPVYELNEENLKKVLEPYLNNKNTDSLP